MSIRLRNRFIALVCLLAFIAVGFLFYVNWVVQKPFAVILFITDNLSPSAVTAARIYQGGADNRLHLEGLAHLGLLTTQSNDFAVSDPASAATAMATGQKVNNRSVGVDSSGKPLTTLMDIARSRHRAVGLITNGSLSDPAPAAFYARTNDPRNRLAIAADMAEAASLDVILGGGKADFLPEHKGGNRTDGRDLMLEMRQKGYDIVRNKSELFNTPAWRAPRVLGVFAPGNLAFSDEIEVAGAQPSLAEMVRQAIQLLQYNGKGYLLIVDAGLVGKAASKNQGERMLRELLALDDAVATALEFAGEDSLILVAGKQTIGGLQLNGYPFRNDKGIAVVGVNSQGIPSLTWSTGPGRPPEAPAAAVPAAAVPAATVASAAASEPDEPSAFSVPAAVGVAKDGLVVGTGPGAERLEGFKDNTDVFRVVADSL